MRSERWPQASDPRAVFGGWLWLSRRLPGKTGAGMIPALQTVAQGPEQRQCPSARADRVCAAPLGCDQGVISVLGLDGCCCKAQRTACGRSGQHTLAMIGESAAVSLWASACLLIT